MQGFTIILKKDPQEPGKIKHADYQDLLMRLKVSKNVFSSVPQDLQPFIKGDTIPGHWCRIEDQILYIFFPNPKAKRIKFPLEYGQSFNTETISIQTDVYYLGIKYNLKLTFKPHQALLYRIDQGKLENIDIEFVPKEPVRKERPADYKAPWLVAH